MALDANTNRESTVDIIAAKITAIYIPTKSGG